MPDKRTPLQKWLWDKIGPPLYYCAECKLAVKVTPVPGHEPLIDRPCDCTAQIIAPRTAICVGKGGASLATKCKIAWNEAKAAVTGRNA